MAQLSRQPGPIGVFDSGYGGLTILHSIRRLLPQYDFLYLGDNARAPYGTRSFEVVYEFTLQAVTKLFEMGCHLVILGCNTASAKALRSIQQNDLPHLDAKRRVLGVIPSNCRNHRQTHAKSTCRTVGYRGNGKERELSTRDTEVLSRYSGVRSGMPFLGSAGRI